MIYKSQSSEIKISKRKDRTEDKLPQLHSMHCDLTDTYTWPSTNLYFLSGTIVAAYEYGALLCRWEMKKAEGKAEAKSSKVQRPGKLFLLSDLKIPSKGENHVS